MSIARVAGSSLGSVAVVWVDRHAHYFAVEAQRFGKRLRGCGASGTTGVETMIDVYRHHRTAPRTVGQHLQQAQGVGTATEPDQVAATARNAIEVQVGHRGSGSCQCGLFGPRSPLQIGA